MSVITLLVTGCGQPSVEIQKITTEFLETPSSIFSSQPRFGWQLRSKENGTYQSAYQIILNEANLEYWNTGKVTSDQSQLIEYEGPQLNTSTRYQLTIHVWDQNDQLSSSSSWFETAPSIGNLKANWIGAIRREDANLPEGRKWHAPSLKKNRAFYDSIPTIAKRSILLRKELNVDKKLSKATVYISGLGHYELNVNGEKVGKSQFAPLWTDYDKSVFYNSYDLTTLLKPGNNAIGVILGNGMYNSVGNRYRKFWVSFGAPTLFFQLELTFSDGSKKTVISDETWKYSESPITFNCIFGGEDYDARLEQDGWATVTFSDADWKPAIIQDAPKGELKPQLAPAIQIQKQYDIKESTQIDSVTYVFDMEQNLSGFPTIKVKGKAGQKVKLVVGERLDEEGKVTQRNTGGPHYYEYTLKGGEAEVWQPRFSYYGYQYIQVEVVSYEGGTDKNDLPVLLGLKSNFIYSNARPLGTFECSNEIFTKTHTLINNAIKSNMQAVFTDCPHREKLGWLEEIQLVGPGLLFNYDLTQSFAKQMMDMKDAQRANGMVPNIAPEYTDFSAYSWGADFTDSPEWGAAAVLVPWQYYEFYGDPSLIQQYYEVMKDYVDYLTFKSKNGIVSHGLGDWYDYGEHEAGYSKNSPIPLSATSHYYYCIEKLIEAAQLLGKTRDKQKYKVLAYTVREAYNRTFFNPETKQYGTGSQYSNAVSIYMDLVGSEHKQAVLDNLVSDIVENGNRLTTGDVGNRYLFQTLAENGLNEVLYKMMNHYDVPGYGYQLQYGLTTLTEQWDPDKGNSWNHFMMGQIEEWFFKTLLGIVPDLDNPGFKHFYVQPQLVGNMTFARGSFESIYGQIVVDWKHDEETFEIEIVVPVNASATFVLPEEVDSGNEKVSLSSGKHILSFPVK
ncbi:MAG: family 78 glycoside hydrolase catalytic domain [Cyclobacteriaceae bacterium]